MSSEPLVTIVTPSLNAGEFIDETIQSVLNQDYPNIEYIVIDGGSTDETCEIVSRYLERLRLDSQPDSGQAAAVNKGFGLGRGEIFGFLNADDIYRPGAVSEVVDAFRRSPAAGVIYGDADWIDERSAIIRRYPTADYDFQLFESQCFICQPAAFMRSNAFRAVRGVTPELRFALDYDLWIRLGRRFEFRRIDSVLAGSRMHRANKTLGRRSDSFRENINVVRRHFGYVPIEMIYGFCVSVIGPGDLFFELPKPSTLASLLSIPAGLYFNRAHPGRFLNAVAHLTARKVLTGRVDPD